MPLLPEDVTGQKFNKLLAIKRIRKSHGGRWIWLFKCDCGKDKESTLYHVKAGKAKSCGCYAKDKLNDYNKNKALKPIQDIAHKKIIGWYKIKAKNRGLSWNLTDQEAINNFSENCFYCGKSPSNNFRWRNNVFNFNGIDRVNNCIGYELENIVPCCFICNWAKKDVTINEFKTWIISVHSHLNLEGRFKNES